MGFGNRRWLPEDDKLIEEAAGVNHHCGLKRLGDREYANRLRAVAERLNRTYAATRGRPARRLAR